MEYTSKNPFLSLPRDQQRSALEALLFASDESLSPRMLYKLLVDMDEQAEITPVQDNGDEETGEKAVGNEMEAPAPPKESLAKFNRKQTKMKEALQLFEHLITELNEDFEVTNRAFRIVAVAGGYQFATVPQYGELVARLVKSKSKRRLSQAGLETLAIIAYRQPISKPEIEMIRGVSCNEVVNTLLEKNLVTIVGRSEGIGKPLLYGTTEDFLRVFGLHDISDLPKPRELEELMESRGDLFAKSDTVMISGEENVEEIEEKLQGHGRKTTQEESQENTENSETASGIETREQSEHKNGEPEQEEEPLRKMSVLMQAHS